MKTKDGKVPRVKKQQTNKSKEEEEARICAGFLERMQRQQKSFRGSEKKINEGRRKEGGDILE